MNKNRICVILPYFGKFNGYFNLWLQSCGYNSNIDWYIFTDDNSKFKYPANVSVTYCTFTDVQLRAYSLWGKNIMLDKPYDLCKFRVAYHELFPQVVDEYEYWGYCDCDLIFGDIYSAILPAIRQKYDKVSWRGHFTLFRNSPDNRNAYLTVLPGIHTFMDCISRGEKDYYNLFDEVGINLIFDALGKKTYKDLLIADLEVKSYNFICMHYSNAEDYKNKQQIFEWNDGHLYRCSLFGGKLIKEEFAYIHFLRRKMKSFISPMQQSKYLIVPPNKFICYQEVTPKKVSTWTEKRFYWDYYKERMTFKSLSNFVIRKVFRHSDEKLKDVYPYIIK